MMMAVYSCYWPRPSLEHFTAASFL